MKVFVEDDGNILSPGYGASCMNLYICIYVKIHRTEHSKSPFYCRFILRYKFTIKVSLLMLCCYPECTTPLEQLPDDEQLTQSFGTPFRKVRTDFGESQ